MASFKVKITPSKLIAIQVLGSEAAPDGSTVAVLQKEILLKPKVAELLKDRLESALTALREAELDSKEDHEIDSLEDKDLDDDEI